MFSMKEVEEPKVLFIRATEACNANCFMCNFAKKNAPYFLTENMANLLSERLQESSIKHIRITGGEPLLSNNIANVVSIFKSKGLVVSIITNGMLLKRSSKGLMASGIDQIIISLDSSHKEVHDKLRNTKGLFKLIVAGITELKKLKPLIQLRINTVVSKYNIEELPQMFMFFNKLGIRQWSLIPIKPFPKTDDILKSVWFNVRKQLAELEKELKYPELMGYSLSTFGKDELEYDKIFNNNCSQTPKHLCNTVNLIRFLDLKTNQVFPCNCIPHRKEFVGQFGKDPENYNFNSGVLEKERKWLYENASKICKGCEPLNAALGDGQIDLDYNILDF